MSGEKHLVGLADCNNFYASCERVFRPELEGRPIVVLSNNDGCVVARSEEVKRLGVKMGVPMYQIRDLAEREGIAVFSSNYELYGDMSNRVMKMLGRYVCGVDQYSIDEAFLDLSGLEQGDALKERCEEMVRMVKRGVHIPISVGIAETKTLAKMASRFAKKYKGYNGVCMIDTEEKRVRALQLTKVGDVFGIGRRAEAKLTSVGVKTAWDLTQCSEAWVRKMLTVTGVRTWRELRGESCINLDDLPIRKSICTSRSFADGGLHKRDELEGAVANFASECGRKLRLQGACCREMIVFAYTSRFRTDVPTDVINRVVTLETGTSNSIELVARAVEVVRSEWKGEKFGYKKAGVIVTGIEREGEVQMSLFDKRDRAKEKRLQKAIDEINGKLGGGMVRSAVQSENGVNGEMKAEHRSKRYTTRINEIMEVR